MTSQTVFDLQASFCQAMGHTARLQILHVLRDSPQSVSQLTHTLGLAQPTISRHLKILRNAGVVSLHRQGNETLYQIANPKILSVCDLLHELLAEQAAHDANLASIF